MAVKILAFLNEVVPEYNQDILYLYDYANSKIQKDGTIEDYWPHRSDGERHIIWINPFEFIGTLKLKEVSYTGQLIFTGETPKEILDKFNFVSREIEMQMFLSDFTEAIQNGADLVDKHITGKFSFRRNGRTVAVKWISK